MRPLLVLVLALAIFGTLAVYERFVATLPPPERSTVELPEATGQFSLELTLSCDAAKDEFGLDDDPAVVVRMAGEELIRVDQAAAADESLRADDVAGIVAGRNAVFLRVVPAPDFIALPCAARLRVLRDENVIAENTLWSQPGGVIAGEVMLEVSE